MSLDVLTESFARNFPDEFARQLARGSQPEVFEVLDALPPELGVPVAQRLPPGRFSALIADDDARLKGWLEKADVDDAVAFVGRMPRNQALGLVETLENRGLRRRLLRALRFPPHCVGALMSGRTLQVPGSTTIIDVLEELRRLDAKQEIPVLVLDEIGRYRGKLDLWALLLRDRPTGTAGEFALQVAPLNPETATAQARTAPQWRQHAWLPVVDYEQRVLGSVTRTALDPLPDESGSSLVDNVVDLGEEFFRVSSDLLENVLTSRQNS